MWLTGDDGNVLVWVMGDHPKDLSIEAIAKDKEKANTKKFEIEKVYFLLLCLLATIK